MPEFVNVERRSEITIITLNRPEVMNAWHHPMRVELVAEFDAFERDESQRAVILTGAGDRAFCAGQDLNETKKFDIAAAKAWIGEWESLYGCIRGLTKPFVAALNGVAAGSAFQVALLADIRVGHAGVRMGQPEINSGIPGALGPWLLRETLGLSRAVELALTGRLMDAEECHSLGLIHRIVPQSEVLAASIEVARDLGQKPPIAMRLTKRRFRAMTEQGFRDSLDALIPMQEEAYEDGEPARYMAAFLERRKARG
jgi:enoyl-CoA hydratase